MSEKINNEFLKDLKTESKNEYDKIKNQADKIEIYFFNSTKKTHQKLAERVGDCSRVLKFGKGEDEDAWRLVNANYCRVRFCPICQMRRSMRYRAIAFGKLSGIVKEGENNMGKLHFVFLTLTIKNCKIEELRTTVKKMNHAWGKLRRLKIFENSIVGFIKSVEVTKNEKDNSAHPHIHALLCVKSSYFKKNYISQARWTELWQNSLKVEYTPIVNVKKVRTDEKGVPNVRAVLEILKYTTKTDDLIGDGSPDSKNWFLELSDQLVNMRFISTGGIFKKLFCDEDGKEIDIEDEPQNEEELELLKFLWFEWIKNIKKYKKIT